MCVRSTAVFLQQTRFTDLIPRQTGTTKTSVASAVERYCIIVL